MADFIRIAADSYAAILDGLVPEIDAAYRTLTDRWHRAVAGLERLRERVVGLVLAAAAEDDVQGRARERCERTESRGDVRGL